MERCRHQLSYRQLEYTYRLIVTALAEEQPDGTPSETLSDVIDALLEASVQVLGDPASSCYAVDWTDHETWSRPPPKPAAARTPDRAGRRRTPDRAGRRRPPARHRRRRRQAGEHPGRPPTAR